MHAQADPLQGAHKIMSFSWLQQQRSTSLWHRAGWLGPASWTLPLAPAWSACPGLHSWPCVQVSMFWGLVPGIQSSRVRHAARHRGSQGRDNLSSQSCCTHTTSQHVISRSDSSVASHHDMPHICSDVVVQSTCSAQSVSAYWRLRVTAKGAAQSRHQSPGDRNQVFFVHTWPVLDSVLCVPRLL